MRMCVWVVNMGVKDEQKFQGRVVVRLMVVFQVKNCI